MRQNPRRFLQGISVLGRISLFLGFMVDDRMAAWGVRCAKGLAQVFGRPRVPRGWYGAASSAKRSYAPPVQQISYLYAIKKPKFKNRTNKTP